LSSNALIVNADIKFHKHFCLIKLIGLRLGLRLSGRDCITAD